MQLYFITAQTNDGMNLDLFVTANDQYEAGRIWRNYYGKVTVEDLDKDSKRTFTVPTLGQFPRAHGWHHEVKQVGGK